MPFPIVILVAGATVPAISARRGDYPRWIRETVGDAWGGGGVEHDLRVHNAGAPLPRPRSASAFVITGSSSSVTERAPWMLRAEQLVRVAVAARVPVLGLCFGHQLIATALGGEVVKNPKCREIGTVRLDRVADDPIFARLPRSFPVNATHVDAVVRLPPGAEVIATTAKDAASAFRVGPRVHGVQFHPEFDDDVMRGYLHARSGVIREEGGDPDALLAAVGGARGRDILRAFGKRVRVSVGVSAGVEG